MSDADRIAQDLLQAFCKEFGLNEKEVDVHTPLFSRNYLDSMDLINVVNYIEKAFAIKINTLEVSLDNFDTIQGISQYIAKKISS